jgi:fumarate reductase flavoprotein subunit
MKTRNLVLLVVAALLIACGNTPSPGGAAMKAGTYEATAKGFYGDFGVSVTVSKSAITAISAGEHKETPDLGGKAIGILTERIIAANTTGVDSVSGATITSAAFKAAVAEAIAKAGASPALSAAPPAPSRSSETQSADVLVIGAGAAGFSAAIAAAEAGAEVILIEKQDITGGTTVTSAGIVYAAVDPSDYKTMVDYYMTRAEGKADRALLQYFAEHSLETISFLEGLGVKWMMTIPAGTAPQPRARFSMHEDGRAMIGSALIDPMEAKAQALGVKILTGVKGLSLIQNSQGAVTGAKAQSKSADYTFNAKAVVLATGGFDGSEEMKAKYSPIAVGDFPLSSKGNKGEGITMGLEVGAATVFNGGVIGFEFVDGSLPESGYNAPAMYCQIYTKTDGTYIGPCQDYPINYTTLKKAGDKQFAGIFDEASAHNPMVGDIVDRAIARGFGWKGDTAEALAKAAGMDPAKLTAAIAQGKLGAGPYYAVVVKTTTIGTMGGLKTDTKAQVLKNGSNSPIPGLYAAGEVANGGFYYIEYPASGSSNSLSITFGRAAGANAAAFAKK